MVISPSEPRHDPIRLEVLRQLFTAIAEEMGATLRRAAFSPNIKERRDYSCAVFHPTGIPVAMGDHMPVHLGAMPMSVQAALAAHGSLDSGDVIILNDPFEGGTHLPDLTLVSPVHFPDSGDLLGYVAARAHHSDVGGMSPGSMPLSREIFQEGLRIPPIHLKRRGTPVPEVYTLLMANVRTPQERAGDLDAQIGALHTGSRRLIEMATARGTASVLSGMEDLLEYADRLLARGIERIPDGSYGAIDHIEDDGAGSDPLPIRVALEVKGSSLRVDFTGSAGQTPGGVNAVSAITSSATRYVLRCVVEALLEVALPAGGGRLQGVDLTLPRGSIVNAEPPAGVAAGNVETSQRITDVLLLAFQQALPDIMPALSQGTMNNLTAGGVDPRSGRAFTYYETAGGGMGAGPDGPGLSAVHVHMSNTLNTPIEALEHAYPFRVRQYGIRRESGGRGLHRGGEGLVRTLEFLAPANVTLLSERRRSGPAGVRGGEAGTPGENLLTRGSEISHLPSKVTFDARNGDLLTIRSPGGGGWGDPEAQRSRTSQASPGPLEPIPAEPQE
ncbi:MAG: hydantoinase B/oxoprolinase family protein [Gemmatimonadales bacterium]|nr:MAG: hydantoinase B/oxoprolinase family protein [Gemmatimonadales bacterium]